MYDIYVRVSQVGDRETESFGSPEVQEAACRRVADHRGWEIGEVVEELDVSGGRAVRDRRLETLVLRCERGESEGILVRHLDRFGRDLIEGALALRRLASVGSRLVAVEDGFDSSSPGSRLVFDLRMAIAEDYIRRSKEHRRIGQERAAERGIYTAKPPFGYVRDEAKRLVVNEREALVVHELFARRAQGMSLSDLVRWLRDEHAIVRSRPGLRNVIMNRAYLGECVLLGRKVMLNHHEPLVTPSEFEAANAVKNPRPRRTGRTRDVMLKGLVFCASCRRRASVGVYGRGEIKNPLYTCTNPTCTGRAAMSARRLDGAVIAALNRAISADDQDVIAAVTSDALHRKALADIADAETTLAEYRDNVELQRLLGIADWTAGLEPRKAAVRTARAALAALPPRELPAPPTLGDDVEAFKDEWRRRYREVIAEVQLSARDAAHRLQVRWVGTDILIPIPHVPPGRTP